MSPNVYHDIRHEAITRNVPLSRVIEERVRNAMHNTDAHKFYFPFTIPKSDFPAIPDDYPHPKEPCINYKGDLITFIEANQILNENGEFGVYANGRNEFLRKYHYPI